MMKLMKLKEYSLPRPKNYEEIMANADKILAELLIRYHESISRKYVDINVLSQHLSIPKSTLYQWVHIGYMPHYKLRGCLRFNVEEVERWVRRRRVKGRDTYVPRIIE